jgi:hypothetical protein
MLCCSSRIAYNGSQARMASAPPLISQHSHALICTQQHRQHDLYAALPVPSPPAKQIARAASHQRLLLLQHSSHTATNTAHSCQQLRFCSSACRLGAQADTARLRWQHMPALHISTATCQIHYSQQHPVAWPHGCSRDEAKGRHSRPTQASTSHDTGQYKPRHRPVQATSQACTGVM